MMGMSTMKFESKQKAEAATASFDTHKNRKRWRESMHEFMDSLWWITFILVLTIFRYK